jgi:hypothetical protein
MITSYIGDPAFRDHGIAAAVMVEAGAGWVQTFYFIS